MKISESVNLANLKIKCGNEHLEREVTGGYCGDLLSDVMANSKNGNIWITMQVHLNIVAVSVLKEHSAIILVNSRQPNEDTLKKAVEENIPILISDLPAFELAGKINSFGIGKN